LALTNFLLLKVNVQPDG